MGERSIGFGHAWEGKVIFMPMAWQKGQFYKPSSLENVPLSFVHRIGHGGSFASPSALATGKQIAVGDTLSSTNCQQLAQDGCSLLTVLAA